LNSLIKVDPKLVDKLSEAQVLQFKFFWPMWVRAAQAAPRGQWTTWMMMGGRGAGKTRAGAEWIRNLAARGVSPLAIVSESMVEALAVMVRGESGILRVHPPHQRPKRGDADLGQRRRGDGARRRGPRAVSGTAVRGGVVR
jgi:phage terminase large subunit-like protein